MLFDFVDCDSMPGLSCCNRKSFLRSASSWVCAAHYHLSHFELIGFVFVGVPLLRSIVITATTPKPRNLPSSFPCPLIETSATQLPLRSYYRFTSAIRSEFVVLYVAVLPIT